ncbi:hypothetical protein ERJ75_000847200 [Trypanosoma vivax]|nr:hypothetical protein ERJ75_000847200 [Trypanosoma vivax]
MCQFCQVCSVGPGPPVSSPSIHGFCASLCFVDAQFRQVSCGGARCVVGAGQEPSRASLAVAVLLHSHIMSEARHWPAFRFPHPVFLEVLPPIVVLNSSPVAFSLASVSAPASTASAASFFTSAAPLAASADQRHASHSGREPLAHSCAAFVVFTSSHFPFDTCSFSACQSASLQRATLPAAPVAASTASSAARLARHSTKKSAAVCPFVAPAPPNARAERRAEQPRGEAKLEQHVSYLPASFALCRPAVRSPLHAPCCQPVRPCAHALPLFYNVRDRALR